MSETIYKTSDGREFHWENDAKAHANELAVRDAQTSAYNAAVRDLHVALGKAKDLEKQGDYDGAINILLGYADWKGVPNAIGLICKAKGDYQNAIAWFNKAGSVGIVNRGECYRLMRNYDQAIADCTSYINDCYSKGRPDYVDFRHWKHPNDDDFNRGLNMAYLIRGLAYQGKGDRDRFITDLKKAADLGNQEAVQDLPGEGIPYTPVPPVDPDYRPLTAFIFRALGFAAGFVILAYAVRFITGWFVFGGNSGAFLGVRVASCIFGLIGGLVCGEIASGFTNAYAKGAQNTLFNIALFLAAFSIYAFIYFPASWSPLAIANRIMGKPAVAKTAAPAAQTAAVTADALNLRAEPSGSAALLKTLKKGDLLTITGEAQDGWLPVEHGNDSGWVSAQYVTVGEN